MNRKIARRLSTLRRRRWRMIEKAATKRRCVCRSQIPGQHEPIRPPLLREKALAPRTLIPIHMSATLMAVNSRSSDERFLRAVASEKCSTEDADNGVESGIERPAQTRRRKFLETRASTEEALLCAIVLAHWRSRAILWWQGFLCSNDVLANRREDSGAWTISSFGTSSTRTTNPRSVFQRSTTSSRSSRRSFSLTTAIVWSGSSLSTVARELPQQGKAPGHLVKTAAYRYFGLRTSMSCARRGLTPQCQLVTPQ